MRKITLLDVAENEDIVTELSKIFIDMKIATLSPERLAELGIVPELRVTDSRVFSQGFAEPEPSELDRVKLLLTRSLLIRIQQIHDEENRRNAYHPSSFYNPSNY